MRLYRLIFPSFLLFFISNISYAVYQAPATQETFLGKVESFCPKTVNPKWRESHQIENIAIASSPVCDPDNPFNIAAFVKGTNNVSMANIIQTFGFYSLSKPK